MPRRWYARILAAAALVCGVWLALPWVKHQLALKIVESRSAAAPLRLGGVAPEFVLESSTGGRVRLSDFRGKVVLLNFWATWCGPCRTEIPWFTEFQKDLGPQGFSVIGVAMDDEGWGVVRPFVESQKINYPVVLGDETASTLYGGLEALPVTLLIGRDGKVAWVHRGLVNKADCRGEITELLSRK